MKRGRPGLGDKRVCDSSGLSPGAKNSLVSQALKREVLFHSRYHDGSRSFLRSSKRQCSKAQRSLSLGSSYLLASPSLSFSVYTVHVYFLVYHTLYISVCACNVSV